jgi:2-oxoglutarate ferredoxin oxidoreductase subunit beta
VAFNNHPGSTKSYDYVREHNEAISRIDFITPREEIVSEYAPGEVVDVRQHDGTILRLRSLHAEYDPTNRAAAMAYMQHHHERGEVVTGLLYVDPLATDLHTALNTVGKPLNGLGAGELCPGGTALEKINAALR